MKWLRNNGLTLALLSMFAISIFGQAWAGWLHEIEDQTTHGQSSPALFDYLGSGAFLSAVFENWESEFLQMAAFVILTAYLFQRGSPESKDPEEADPPEDRDPALDASNPHAPWPVRGGRLIRAAYSHSLGLALILLFAMSFVAHWINSARHAADDALAHGQTPPTVMDWLGEPEFWFESFQNWQSEFLSTAVLIVLSIYLRERGSSQSKPVAAPHAKTGTA